MKKIREEVKSTLIFAGIGFIIGLLSAKLSIKQIGLIGLLVLVVLLNMTPKMFKKKEFKFFIGNGIWPYLITWFAVWILMLNV